MKRKYYEAYDERYKTIHEKGFSWAGGENTPIVFETIKKYGVPSDAPMLEVGCGEGMDASFLLEKGFDLFASDVSPEAISYCKRAFPRFGDRFFVSDCLDDKNVRRYRFIYSVAVIHMLVRDGDRNGFYGFIRAHLTRDGVALICTMGDGVTEIATDEADAFDLVQRDHPSGKVTVASTSLRMVSFPRFESELASNGLKIIEKGVTSRMPDFDSLMYAVVKIEE